MIPAISEIKTSFTDGEEGVNDPGNAKDSDSAGYTFEKNESIR